MTFNGNSMFCNIRYGLNIRRMRYVNNKEQQTLIGFRHLNSLPANNELIDINYFNNFNIFNGLLAKVKFR